jgi:hypothetical protein
MASERRLSRVRARCVLALGAAVAALMASCRAPTQIELHIESDIPCSEIKGVGLTLGHTPSTVETSYSVAVTTRCDHGEVGTMFVAPGGSRDERLALRVIAGLGAPPDDYVRDDHDGRFVIARRALSFVPYETLVVPIKLLATCEGQRCTSDTTCRSATQCAPASLDGQCAGGVCASLEDPSAQPPSDGGVPSDAENVMDAPASLDGNTDGDGATELGFGRRIATGNHTCTVRLDRTLWCWGSDNAGQLGDDGQFERAVPARVTGINDVVEVTVHTFINQDGATCALRANGEVWCWGRNAEGQLGDGTTTTQRHPVFTGITDAVQISLGVRHGCAVLRDGHVKCWGNDSVGQLGDGPADAAVDAGPPSPRLVSGLSDAVEVSSSNDFTCARRSNGKVSCWGANSAGQLGDGASETSVPAPTEVLSLSNVAAIGTLDDAACAVLTDGSARCWGANSDLEGARSGNGIFIATNANGVANATAIGSGHQYNCVATTSHGVTCWGGNENGTLGDGTRSGPAAPQAVPGFMGVAQLAAGEVTTCALKLDESIYCWGNNYWGQVGDGTMDRGFAGQERNSPTATQGLP